MWYFSNAGKIRVCRKLYVIKPILSVLLKFINATFIFPFQTVYKNCIYIIDISYQTGSQWLMCAPVVHHLPMTMSTTHSLPPSDNLDSWVSQQPLMPDASHSSHQLPVMLMATPQHCSAQLQGSHLYSGQPRPTDVKRLKLRQCALKSLTKPAG